MLSEQRGCSSTSGKRTPCIFPLDSLNLPVLPPWLCWPPVYKKWDNTLTLQDSSSTKSHELKASCPSTALRFPSSEHEAHSCLPNSCFVPLWLKAGASCNICECPPYCLKNGGTCAKSVVSIEYKHCPQGLQPHQPCWL